MLTVPVAATCHSDEMVEMYNQFCKNYPVISIEDPFDQDDSASSTKFTAEGVCQACTQVQGSRV